MHDLCACSMADEFPQLMPDISQLAWADEAFEATPEATNLWIGGDESVTSFHKASAGTITLFIPLHRDGIGMRSRETMAGRLWSIARVDCIPMGSVPAEEVEGKPWVLEMEL